MKAPKFLKDGKTKQWIDTYDVSTIIKDKCGNVICWLDKSGNGNNLAYKKNVKEIIVRDCVDTLCQKYTVYKYLAKKWKNKK